MPLADRRHHIDDAGGQVFGAAVALFQHETFMREKRRQVLEEYFAFRIFRRVMIDLADLQQCKIAFPVFGRPDKAGNGVAGPQTEAPDLAGRDVNVVGACQV